ncbi:hypothetical protein ACTOB_005203 [Actinoplanes oblitus]|uniref:Uncharacterized protein n=1 Tax=Actinoplanes oblitus TaxID=3040509 RepID=A0ABY8W5X7_9ACTN|nr:hypothetical protein [Actinoplanes oblitus]WIM93231.1 hypothetical protein ACTOB_005203 [Actinoplanes oblitus]
MSRLFHVSSVLNRDSIRRHGLDWTRMGAARNIAGSRAPEVEGCFLCDEATTTFFIRINNTGGPVDVWAVDGVGEEQLVTSPEGFEYYPGRIPAQQVTLHRPDVPA